MNEIVFRGGNDNDSHGGIFHPWYNNSVLQKEMHDKQQKLVKPRTVRNYVILKVQTQFIAFSSIMLFDKHRRPILVLGYGRAWEKNQIT